MRNAASLLLATLVATSAGAGSFHLSDTTFYPSFIVVHPAPYDGTTGGPLEVKVCIPPGAAEVTRPALDAAIAIWSGLTPATENCLGCRTIEQGSAGTGEPFSMATVLLHELGHCGAGLGHINWEDAAGHDTSFTATQDATAFDAGPDMICGSRDDRPTPLPGSRVLHWFRTADNDPFAHSLPVDSTTFSRRILDLPGGHSWPASGNFGVALLLGHVNTQAVMYSYIDEGTTYSALAADDVNTERFGMAGMDEMAGTSDDYTVTFLMSDCASADIEVTYTDLDGGTGLGTCLADVEPLPTDGLEIHHVLTPFHTDPRAVIEINRTKRFDVVFANGFETGDVSAWSSSVQ